MSHRAALIVALLGLAATGATCKGDQKSPKKSPPPISQVPEAPPPVTEIEGVDIALIPPTARKDFVRILNESFAYCGCDRTIAACLADKEVCNCPQSSQRMTDFIVNQLQQGASMDDVENTLLTGFSEGYNKQPHALTGEPASKGPAGAPVVLAEFADFKCPHCAVAFATLERVVAERDDVQLQFYYFPLSGYGLVSQLAAEAAEEARLQGKFWAMAGLMYRNQAALTGLEDILRFGQEAGLDIAKLTKALDKRVHRDTVLASKRLGESVGVRSTPSVFVNGRPFGLPRTEQVFGMRIDMELDRGQCN